MSSRHFSKGELLFQEGDPVDGVLRILRGTVEIVRQRNGADIVLGAVQAGQVLGEMGVIENRPRRSATARAADDVEAEAVGAADFLDDVSRSPKSARDLIQRLSRRLHEAEDRIVADELAGPARPSATSLGDSGPVAGLALAAASRALRRQLAGKLAIGVPFVIGRAPLPGEQLATRRVDLLLQDREPLRLSRNHFAVVQRQGRLYVRDLHSTLGTTVNGQPIGEHFGADEAPLRAGENQVIAGGVGSPFSFSIVVGAEAKGPGGELSPSGRLVGAG